MIRFVFAYFLFLLAFQGAAQPDNSLKTAGLQCEYLENPRGIESRAPRFSWQLVSDRRGTLQQAYRLLVADSPEKLAQNQGNIWDSGKVKSDQSLQVSYAGAALQPAATYYWKVMAWDNKGQTSAWSAPALWQMGLPAAADWQGARWIAYEELPASHRIVPAIDNNTHKELGPGRNVLPLLRKEFTVQKPLKQATLFISGLGHFEASLNGSKVGDHFLDPGWTDYAEQALYVAFDVSQHLQPGANALGVMLGNGFYHIPRERYRKLTGSFGYPKMICRLALEYADGSREEIISDGSWKTAAGPITFSSIYGGEDYDAPLEQPGWDRPGFRSDNRWKAVVLTDGPQNLNAQLATPVKLFETFSPLKVTQPRPGVWVYDLGQNASGIVQVTARGARGATLKITPGELLTAEGMVNQKATGSPYTFNYTLKGGGTETWQPRFTYYGFRYVQVEGGVPDKESNSGNLPVVLSLKGLHNRNAARPAGQFHTSSGLFNKTGKLIDWAIRSNMMSVFTDCPHREKLGWLEEAHLVGASVRYNYDIASLCRKVVRDMQYAQTPEGLIPEIAPEYVVFTYGNGMFRDSPEWGSNGIILPWYMYQWYGDRQVLADSYPMMQRYIAYLQTKAKDHILSQGLGDWFDLGPKRPGVSQLTPMGVTGTAIYYYDLNIISQVARLLGKPEDAKKYDQLAAEVKTAFNKTFFNPQTKQYATGSQTANAMAVYMKLVEPQHKQAVVDNIVQDIRNRNNSLTAGDIGYRYLLRVLDDENRSDVIFDMNSRTDVPGYGYQLAQGATALTESWAALPNVSNNHFMLGHLLEWFYSGLGGIRPSEKALAFKAIDIRPEPVGDVTTAQVSHQSPYGQIATDWKKEGGRFSLTVEIPANTTATVYLPATPDSRILENGKVLKKKNKDMKLLGYANSRARVQVGSGIYHFVVEN